MGRVARTLLWLLAAFALFAAVLASTLLHTLSARPGEWTLPVKLGPLTRSLSVPTLIRIATHPLGLALLDGRSTTTPFGRWAWQHAADGRLVGRCAPCTLRLDALGPAPVMLPQAELSLQRRGQNRFFGSLALAGDGSTPRLALAWRADLSAQGLAIEARLPSTPLADAYAAFGAAAIPELARARIGGRVEATLHARWPERMLRVEPRIDGFEVAGLGTEALIGVAPPARCAAPLRAGSGVAGSDAARARSVAASVDGAARIVGWLPRAVVAAEDQRFHEHVGYDLTQLRAAWSTNQRPGEAAAAPQGASTLTQQLAKLVYVGDERSAVRKLRELLYAVEMERTLGKGRILQLYLAMAPWGDGVCGAEAASRRYLGKGTARLTPLEAAWLASLLRDGRGADRALDTERVGWVLASLRGPLSAERRAEQLEALRVWVPPGR